MRYRQALACRRTFPYVWPAMTTDPHLTAAQAALEASDYATALRHLRPLAEAGEARAQRELGLMLLAGQGLPCCPADAAMWLRRAAEQDDPEAQYRLGRLLSYGHAPPPELEGWHRSVLAAKDSSAALFYPNGIGQPADPAEAALWLERAAATGHAAAAFELGLLHGQGRGIPADPGRAADCFRAAAEQGHPQAQFRFGLIHLTGQGVARDTTVAAHWLGRAAEQGVAAAQVNLAILHVNGDGVPRDVERARHWFEEAARLGDPVAQINLGRMFSRGIAVPPSPATALSWYRQAAEAGLAQARLELGLLLAEGEARDPFEAALWLSRALEELPPGEPRDQAAAVLARLRDELDADQLGRLRSLLGSRIARRRPRHGSSTAT